MNKEEIRALILELGADLCGFSPVKRFEACLKGFHPCDILESAQSVIVFARRIPESVFIAKSPVPYTKVNDIVIDDLIKIGIQAALHLEDNGITALPIPSEPYEYWEEDNKKGKGILSLKEAGYLAGLGVIGKNSLLTNKTFGNRILLNALIIDQQFDGDEIDKTVFCMDSCRICIENCKTQAIEDNQVNQKKCREYSGYTNTKGYFLYVCNHCRMNCPFGRGYSSKLT